MNKIKYIVLMLCLLVVGWMCAQVQRPAALGGVPEYVGYTQVYDLVEELADMGIISVNSVVKPYDRNQIAAWLMEAAEVDSLLSVRQRKELWFYLNDFALECEGMYDGVVQWSNSGRLVNKELWGDAFQITDYRLQITDSRVQSAGVGQQSTVNGQQVDPSVLRTAPLKQGSNSERAYSPSVLGGVPEGGGGNNSSLTPCGRDFCSAQASTSERVYSSPKLGEVPQAEGYVNSSHLTPHTSLFSLSLLQPAFHYADKWFECKINPILGMDLTMNKHGMVMHRWYGAEIRADIVDHVAVWGSIRDHSYSGEYLNDEYFPTAGHKAAGAYLSRPGFMNTLAGGAYHAMTYGADYAEIRAGIKAYTWWGSIGLVKENVQWGDSYHSSNILSGRAPSFPMIELKLKPCRWFRLDYIHGFLASGVVDSTRYYVGKPYVEGAQERYYLPAAKYLAANMLTFTPVRGLDLSVGSAVVYGNSNLFAAMSLPISFFNSIDYQMASSNDNSQIFLNISTRNLRYTHFYASLFVDEFSLSRWREAKEQFNFFGWKVGVRVSNWPVKDLSVMVEYTQTNPGTYEHLYDVLKYTSNGYGLGHYLGDNAREVVAKVTYKPVRGLTLDVSYVGAWKYNELVYGYGTTFITRKPYENVVWRSDEVKLHAVYEVVNNAYAFVDVGWSNMRGFDVENNNYGAEIRLDAEGYLKRYTPAFYWGQNVTLKMGFSFYY